MAAARRNGQQMTCIFAKLFRSVKRTPNKTRLEPRGGILRINRLLISRTMSNFDRINLKEMTIRDMENYMKKTVADTLDKPKSFDRRQWLETYDLRTQIKEDVKKRDKERSTTSSHKREEVFVLNGRGEKVEVTANFHVQSGFTGGIPRYESQSSSCKRMLKFGSDKIEDKKM